MGLLRAVVLGLVQGITEFLPISSTAHLRIVPALLGWPDPGAAFDAIIQLGTVAAVLVYFRGDIVRLFTAWGEASPLVTLGVVAAIAAGIGSQYLPPRIPLAIMARFSRLHVAAQAVVLALALLATNSMGPEGVAPFIYFRF